MRLGRTFDPENTKERNDEAPVCRICRIVGGRGWSGYNHSIDVGQRSTSRNWSCLGYREHFPKSLTKRPSGSASNFSRRRVPQSASKYAQFPSVEIPQRWKALRIPSATSHRGHSPNILPRKARGMTELSIPQHGLERYNKNQYRWNWAERVCGAGPLLARGLLNSARGRAASLQPASQTGRAVSLGKGACDYDSLQHTMFQIPNAYSGIKSKLSWKTPHQVWFAQVNKTSFSPPPQTFRASFSFVSEDAPPHLLRAQKKTATLWMVF